MGCVASTPAADSRPARPSGGATAASSREPSDKVWLASALLSTLALLVLTPGAASPLLQNVQQGGEYEVGRYATEPAQVLVREGQRLLSPEASLPPPTPVARAALCALLREAVCARSSVCNPAAREQASSCDLEAGSHWCPTNLSPRSLSLPACSPLRTLGCGMQRHTASCAAAATRRRSRRRRSGTRYVPGCGAGKPSAAPALGSPSEWGFLSGG
jgi:hypothetical protein